MAGKLDVVFLTLLVATAIGALKTHKLFTLVILMSAFSFLSASLFFVYDAVDVSLTEAAVGVGISTILFLSTLVIIPDISPKKKHKYDFLIFILFCFSGFVFLFFLPHLPLFGQADKPSYQHLGKIYNGLTMFDVKIKNVVSALLAYFRGYDTLGETTVILTAYIGVLTIFETLKAQALKESISQHITLPALHSQKSKRGATHLVLRLLSKFFLPIIALFAFYVQIHGDEGPGGGFQAGALLTVCVFIYTLLYGKFALDHILTKRWLQVQAALGVFIYAGVGLLCVGLGSPFLDYTSLSSNAVFANRLGIFLVELGVGMTVFSVLSIIFMSFLDIHSFFSHDAPENEHLPQNANPQGSAKS